MTGVIVTLSGAKRPNGTSGSSTNLFLIDLLDESCFDRETEFPLIIVSPPLSTSHWDGIGSIYALPFLITKLDLFSVVKEEELVLVLLPSNDGILLFFVERE